MKWLAKAWGSVNMVMAAGAIAAGCSIAVLVRTHHTNPVLGSVGGLAMQLVCCVLWFRVLSLGTKKPFAALIDKMAKEMPLSLTLMKIWFGCVLFMIICDITGLLFDNSSIAAAGAAVAVLIFSLTLVMIICRYLWKRLTKATTAPLGDNKSEVSP